MAKTIHLWGKAAATGLVTVFLAIAKKGMNFELAGSSPAKITITNHQKSAHVSSTH